MPRLSTSHAVPVAERHAHKSIPNVDQAFRFFEVHAREPRREVGRQNSHRALRLEDAATLGQKRAQLIGIQLRDEIFRVNEVGARRRERQRLAQIHGDLRARAKVEIDADPARDRIGSGTKIQLDHRWNGNACGFSGRRQTLGFAASTVAAMSSSECAAETKPASNADGAR